jgi:hypothetical protein
MNSVLVSVIVFACVFGSALLGMLLRRSLPAHYLDADSRDVLKQGMALIGTMAALLLGLLVASAKSSYDAQKNEVTDVAAKVVVVDRLLANYGPEVQESRKLLRDIVARTIDRMWPQDRSHPSTLEPTGAPGELLYLKTLAFTPKDDTQRALQTQISNAVIDLGKARWLMFSQAAGSSISAPLLVVVVLWLAAVFLGLGLLAPPNPTVIAAVFICALSVSGAIFLMLEMDRPFDGIIHLSSAPLRAALEHLGN